MLTIFLLQLPASILEVFLCYCFTNCFIDNLFKKRKLYCIILSIIFGTLLNINRIMTSFFSWVMLLALCVCIWLSLYIVDTTKGVLKFGIVLLYNVCNGILQLLFLYLIIFSNKDLNIYIVYHTINYYRTLCYILESVLFLIVYNIFFRHFKFKGISNKFKWIFLLYGITGLFFIIIFQDRLLNLSRNRMFESLLMFFLLILSGILALVGSSEYFSTKTKLETLELKDSLLEENYNEIKSIYQHYAYTYHDFKNHLLVLTEYCEKHETERAIDYISNISSCLHRIKLFAHFGNEILDIILNYKLKEAENEGIAIKTEIHIENLDYIEGSDFCAIISNLLDNAITACRNVPEGEKSISIVIKDLGDFFIIKISNSYLKKAFTPKSILSSSNPDCLHGYGKKSVKSKVKKYNGTVVWKSDEKFYSAIITFNKTGGSNEY